MKRLFPMLVSVCLIASLMSFANADDVTHRVVSNSAAEALYSAGLFRGTGIGADGKPIFDLDKIPTRNQGIIMFIRLLGKEQEALSGKWSFPFTDVPEEMRAYVGYAYAHSLTNGTTETTFSGTERITANQYLAFVLRALGYVSEQDFIVPNASQFAASIGFIWEPFRSSHESFTRGDLAIISYTALRMPLKDSDTRLVEVIPRYSPENAPSYSPQEQKQSITGRELYVLIDEMAHVYADWLTVEETILRNVIDVLTAIVETQAEDALSALSELVFSAREGLPYIERILEMCGDYSQTAEIKGSMLKIREAVVFMQDLPVASELENYIIALMDKMDIIDLFGNLAKGEKKRYNHRG